MGGKARLMVMEDVGSSGQAWREGKGVIEDQGGLLYKKRKMGVGGELTEAGPVSEKRILLHDKWRNWILSLQYTIPRPCQAGGAWFSKACRILICLADEKDVHRGMMIYVWSYLPLGKGWSAHNYSLTVKRELCDQHVDFWNVCNPSLPVPWIPVIHSTGVACSDLWDGMTVFSWSAHAHKDHVHYRSCLLSFLCNIFPYF